MPRGRQYYDPEIQVNKPVQGPDDLSRIEFYPELDGSGQIGRWVGRRIDHDGRIVGYTAGSFDHDAELARAQELWPGLTVFELNDEQKDSTWEGTGPSPRIWQTGINEHGLASQMPEVPFDQPMVGPRVMYEKQGEAQFQHFVSEVAKAVPEMTKAASEVLSESLGLVKDAESEQQMPLHIVVAAKPGTYVLLDDIRVLLESWAAAHEADKNPSAAMALRDALDVLRDVDAG